VETVVTQENLEGIEDLHHLPDRPSAQPDTKHDGILMQAFGWESNKQQCYYEHVASRIPELQAAGVTNLWLPPPSQSVSPEGYMPGQLYNLTSNYGNEQQLTDLLTKLREAGITPMADIVINHRCADSQDEHGRWNNYHDDHDHEGHPIDWGRWAIVSNDHEFGGQGNKDTGDDFWGAPDLDHANPHLREALTHWLQHLRDNVGFRGWRFDFAKGFAAHYIKEYVDGSGCTDDLNVGELWVDLAWGDNGELEYNQDAARQRICDWIDATEQRSAAFDFPTKGILQEAVKRCEYWRLKDSKGKAPGLLGWWPRQSVTFVDNHDTGSTQQHWPFPADKIGQGYAYMLTHPGTPCLFWEHFFDWGDKIKDEIKALIKVRQDAGLFAKSKLEILAAEGDMYVSRTTGKLGSVVLKMGPKYDMGDLCPKQEDGWQKAAKGKDYCVWIKLDEAAVSN
jgi:alpha-amylase